MARITPALYYLLPENHLHEAIQIQDGLPDTLFDVGLWQLSRAQAVRNKTLAFRLDDAGLHPDDWMGIVGVGEQTRVQLTIEKRWRRT